eukprot:1179762-Prorocentrum_minimum.AAC.8
MGPVCSPSISATSPATRSDTYWKERVCEPSPYTVRGSCGPPPHRTPLATSVPALETSGVFQSLPEPSGPAQRRARCCSECSPVLR